MNGLLLADLAYEPGLISEPVDLDELLAGSVCLSPVAAAFAQASLDVQLQGGVDWDSTVGEIKMLLRLVASHQSARGGEVRHLH